MPCQVPVPMTGESDKLAACPFPFGKLIALAYLLLPVRMIAVRAVLICASLSTLRLPFSMIMRLSEPGELPVRYPGSGDQEVAADVIFGVAAIAHRDHAGLG